MDKKLATASAVHMGNAIIKNTFLGYANGIFTYRLDLYYGDTQQAAGNIVLGGTITDTVIRSILTVVGAESWENLKGKYIRAEYTHDHVCSIGNIINNEWFDLDNNKIFIRESDAYV